MKSQLSTFILQPKPFEVQKQEKHHKKLSFKEEFLAFLKKYKVEYDEVNSSELMKINPC